jgi:hypothetical protein
MGGGQVDFSELRGRTEERASRSVRQILTQHDIHELLNPRGIKHRECVGGDDHPNPLPIAIVIDGTGSMMRVPERLVKNDLLHLLTSLERTGATKNYTPQICFCAVADTSDTAPFQISQFEADNRMDDWLQKIFLGGGGGSEYMHEAYGLALYALARKTKCDIWKNGGKGYAIIAGDEMCPSMLKRNDIESVFGDKVPRDIPLEDLLTEVREKWHLYFFYVATGCYGAGSIETIYQSWQRLLGDRAIRLDADATALSEIATAVIGINEKVFTAKDVPIDLRELGCDERIVRATADALGVSPGQSGKAAPVSQKRRGPKEL